MTIKTRNIAKKYSISKVKNSQFVIPENYEEPNYVLINSDKVYRINVIGAIIDKTEFNNKANFTLDDGDSISLKTFGDMNLTEINVGDTVIVSGRPRQNNEGIFIALETIKKIDPKWITVRKEELIFFENLYSANSENIIANNTVNLIDNNAENLIENEESINSSNSDAAPNKLNDPKELYGSIQKIIGELDLGEGANFIDVLNKLKENNCDLEKSEMMINKMILDGDLFEISGNLKVSR